MYENSNLDRCFLRGFILGGFPWNLIAYSWTNYQSSLQILSFIGTYSFNLLSITIFLLPLIIFFNKKLRTQIVVLLVLLTVLSATSTTSKGIS